MDPVLVDTMFMHLETVQTQLIQPESTQLEYLERLEQSVGTAISELKSEQSQLLGIEVTRSNQIRDRLSRTRPIEFDDPRFAEFDFDPANKGLTGWHRTIASRIALQKAGYHSWIPLSPLLWRDQRTELPVFALFSWDSGLVGFQLEAGSHNNSCQPILPAPIRACYQDVFVTLKRDVTQQYTGRPAYSCQASFQGTIPASTRQKIKAAKDSKLFELYLEGSKRHLIFLLSEVERWAVGEVALPKAVRPDPIVVGWSQHYPDRFFYIDAFDITPLENTIPIVF